MKFYHSIIATLFFTFSSVITTKAQEGNQMLDGIGETALIARYVLDGTINDWSRNNLHASYPKETPTFLKDDTFGKVIQLQGTKESHLVLPPNSLSGNASLTLCGWITSVENKAKEYVLDFGKNEKSRFYFTQKKTANTVLFDTALIQEGDTIHKLYKKVPANEKWHHFSIILDTGFKTISLYFNGTLAATSPKKKFDLSTFLGKSPKLYLGRSQMGESQNLQANMYDFRIYRTPLTAKQIARIYSNALNTGEPTVNERIYEEDTRSNFPEDTKQLYNQFLEGTSDITVTTEQGHLPRLPRYINGIYRNGMEGPLVRVLWEMPTDNSQVQSPGSYTLTGSVPGTTIKPKATITVVAEAKSKVPKLQLIPFPLQDVELNLDSYGKNTRFIENRDKFINTLAKTNPDNFLYMFRNAYGQPQPKGAKALGVWDSQETKLRGHATGHYLTAIAQAYASSSYDKSLQEVFAKKMDYIVSVLHELSSLSGQPTESGASFVDNPSKVPPGPNKETYNSDLSATNIRTDYWNWGKGFISAYPPDQFIMLEMGATYGTKDSQIWAPYYTLHKILAGLMDIYEISGDKRALVISKGMGDWVHDRLSQLPTETLISMWNRYIAGEYGGMNEAMARLSRLTSNSKYLETAKLFDNIRVFYGNAEQTHGLAKNVDLFRGLHANQHIPQIMGALETFRNSHEPKYFKVADNFWYKATNDYMYAIGGVAGARNPANAECFVSEPATLFKNGLSADGQNETCGTYNMLKLTKNLFLFEPKTEYMDYYERGLYNHILASVAEDSPANTYHVPLGAGAKKEFSNGDMSGFTCCNGTALESSTKLQNAIYFKNTTTDELYVNLYIPSTLHWTEKKVSIVQSTAFPKEDRTTLTINGKGKFGIHLRVPSWATNGFHVSINGKKQKISAQPGSYISLKRKWRKGDRIAVHMPFSFRLEPVMDQQNLASLFYGPILLAAQEPEPRTSWRKLNLNANDISTSISGNPKELEFTIGEVTFKPFYDTYGYHSVYLDINLQP